jgi:hypothetical protein
MISIKRIRRVRNNDDLEQAFVALEDISAGDLLIIHEEDATTKDTPQ